MSVKGVIAGRNNWGQSKNSPEPLLIADTGTCLGRERWAHASCITQVPRWVTRSYHIELSPVRAGMVTDPTDYSWSSYRAHALGRDVKMERLTSQRQRHLKRGPKPKPKPYPKDELLL